MKILLLESVAGVAGDMFAAAFLDAGLVSAEAIRAVPGALGLEDVRVTISERDRASMKATYVRVETGDGSEPHVEVGHARDAGQGHGHSHEHDPDGVHGHGHTHSDSHHHNHGRTHAEIDAMIAASDLPGGAIEFARSVFRLLAEAEAAAHGMSVESVHFHEVGALDSIVDVAMAGLCVDTVRPDAVLATPIKLGRGHVVIQHGSHAVPPPASARLAQGFPVAEIPPAITARDVELSTPTGLAILRALSPDFVTEWPPGTLRAQGMGCGTMDLGDYPNVFRVAVFDAATGQGQGVPDALRAFATDRVTEITFNVDDESGERVAWIAGQLLDAGALDVWWTHVVGKKGRPAVQVSLLAEPGNWAHLAEWSLRQTSTFGLRHRAWDRVKLMRSIEVREVGGEEVRYKVGRTTDGEIVKEKAEYEDLRRIWEKGSG